MDKADAARERLREGELMARRDVESLRKYLALITRKQGGIGGTLESPGISEVLESAPALEATRRERRVPAADLPSAARRGMETLARGGEPPEHEIASVEAIIDAAMRPAIDVIDGTFTVTHPLWTRLSEDPAIRAASRRRSRRSAGSSCRASRGSRTAARASSSVTAS